MSHDHQEELLARELAYQRSYGISENRAAFVKENYKGLIVSARRILSNLSKSSNENK